MPGHDIASLEDLEAVVGKTPGAMHLKVIDHLDGGALRWLAASPLAFLGVGQAADAPTVRATLAGGAPGFGRSQEGRLHLPLPLVDDPALLQPGAPFGSLFLVPGIGETLRVNGRVTGIAGGEAIVAVDECYGHCAKALIRSEFWAAPATQAVGASPAELIAGARFMALATVSRDGRADVSPKGDPAGLMAALDDDGVRFADRPGNRRTDSFRNIVEQPNVAAILLTPGSAQVAIVRGRARLSTDPAARARFEVQSKTPLLTGCIEPLDIVLHASGALARASLWPLQPSDHGIDPAMLFVDHIRLNREGGLAARLAGAALSIPGVASQLKKGLEKDYRDNLY